MNTMLNLNQTFKKRVDYALVLITILSGLMLTSCNAPVTQGGTDSGSGGAGNFNILTLPPASTQNISVSVASKVNPQITLMNVNAAYQRGYYGQSVTIAFIDRGITLRGDGSYGHLAFGESGSSRIVKPVRFQGTVAQVTVRNNVTIPEVNMVDNNQGQYHIGIAAGAVPFLNGQIASNTHSGVAISAKIMPIDIESVSISVQQTFLGPRNRRVGVLDGDVITAFEYAVTASANVLFYGFSPSNFFSRSRVHYNGNDRFMSIPSFAQVLASVTTVPASLTNVVTSRSKAVEFATALASVIVGQDVVVVADTGHTFQKIAWNSETGTVTLDHINVSVNYNKYPVAVSTFMESATIKSLGVVNVDATSYAPPYDVTLATLNGSVGIAASVFFGNNKGNMVFGDVQISPFFDARLRSQYLLVAGVDSGGTIRHSNGCGASKNWCVSAPMLPHTDTDRGKVPSEGAAAFADSLSQWSTYGAASAAGALAVIKSRLPNLPMSAARAVLLTTATELGEEGVDDVYGHGLINVGAAISLVGQISVPAPISVTTSSSQLLVNSSIVLSPSFRNLQQQVSNISMAVDVLGSGFYFDSPFSSVMNDDAIQNQVMTLGFAAGDMDKASTQIGSFDIRTNRQGNLANFGFKRKQGLLNYSLCAKCKNSVWDEYTLGHQALPFFADTQRKLQGGWSLGDSIDTFVVLGLDEDNEKDKYAQYGINWKGVELGEWELAGSFSRIQEQQGYLLGSEFKGAFGVGESSSTQLGLRAQRYIEGWRLFGGVEYGKTQTDTINNSLIRRIQGLSYAGWRLGLDKDSVFRSKDKVHMGITRLPSIISGSMDLELSQTTGETAYDDNLAMDYLSKTEFRKHKINLDDSDAFVYRLGYSTNIHKRQRLALGFEHYTDKVNQDNTAFSVLYKVEF